jgi:ribosomal protein S18 acetylase RimI-like enzyme
MTGDGRKQALIRIVPSETADHLRMARRLFRQYADELGLDLEFQGFSRELASLPGDYAPPDGRLLLALASRAAVGCVALRPMNVEICEMKRLYVVASYRGQRIGRRLAETAIDAACRIGYRRMRLDTLESMQAAKSLYAALGFRDIEAYYSNPLEKPAFMEKRLRR